MGNKLLPVKSDFMFKLLFGDIRNVDILENFLKSILDIPEEEYESLSIVDPYLKKESKDDKYGILDVKLQTKSGHAIHIEIQLLPVKAMEERCVFYQAKMVTEQISSGNDYSKIKRVISIIIADFEFTSDDEYHQQFRLRNVKGSDLTKLLEVNTLELTKLPSDTDNSNLWDWAKFIKSEDDVEMLDNIAEKNPQIKKAVGILKELSADERTRMIFEDREKARRDEVGRIEYAEEKGSNKRAVEIAKRMLKRNRPIDEVVEDSGLTLDEISALKSDMQNNIGS